MGSCAILLIAVVARLTFQGYWCDVEMDARAAMFSAARNRYSHLRKFRFVCDCVVYTARCFSRYNSPFLRSNMVKLGAHQSGKV